MSDGFARFNTLPAEAVERDLYSCFASRAWASRIAAGRPYRDLTGLLASVESAWAELGPSDWLDAFAAHPRIGESGGHSPAVSEREQSRVAQSPGDTLAALAAENHRYEARFGHVFLIAASGRTAEGILDELRRRMNNDPDTELEVAAGEHRKITRLRLALLLNE